MFSRYSFVVNLNTILRCVLLNYNPTSKLIDFRHYAIRVAPVGVSKGIKKIVGSKVPNLARCDDISDFFTKSGYLSESEAEDDPASHVTLPQKLSSRGNQASNKSAIKLVELGPRLTLQLVKVENGLLSGEVLFHEFVQKSKEDLQLQKKTREDKLKLKENRKQIQEENKKKKEKKKEDLKQKSLKGMRKKSEHELLMDKAVTESHEADVGEEDVNDAEWYRQEVGEEPEADMFDTTVKSGVKRKRPYGAMLRQVKKLEKDKDGTNDNRTKKKKKSSDTKSESYDRKKKFQSKKTVLGSKISKKNKRR